MPLFRLLLLTVLVVWALLAPAQTGDQQKKLLDLQKANLSLMEAKRQLRLNKVLLDGGLVGQEEYEKTRIAYEQAMIGYQETYISVLTKSAYLSIEKAVKYQAGDNAEKHARITIKNSSSPPFTDEELKALDLAEWKTLVNFNQIRNLHVSLKIGNTIISQPYEAIIDKLDQGEEATVDLALLKDQDEVTVALAFADVKQERTILLQKDTTAERVSITTKQFSQEADLGGKTVYSLTLERYSGTEDTYKLGLAGQPDSVQFEFGDPASGNRINQIQLIKGTSQKDVNLTLFLPERPDEQLNTDKPIAFFLVAVGKSMVKDFPWKEAGKLSEAELSKFKAGRLGLEIIPRGKGELELRAQEMYFEITKEDRPTAVLYVKNRGTRALSNVQLVAELPYEWEGKPSPDLIKILEPGKEEKITLPLIPSPASRVGTSQDRVKAKALTQTTPIESEEKIIQCHVVRKANWLATALLILALVGLVVGIVAYGVRISRR